MENTQWRRTVRAFNYNPAYITTLRYTLLLCFVIRNLRKRPIHPNVHPVALYDL